MRSIRALSPLTRLSLLCTLILLTGFSAKSGEPSKKSKTRPNLLLITIDTLRADRVGALDPSRNLTPNLDRLAKSGVNLTRAFAHTPTTLPSHVNILTGTTPPYHGVHDNFNFAVRRDLVTLAEHLKRNGFDTGAFVGAYPLDSRFGLDQGFDLYDDEYDRLHGQMFNSPERRAEAVVEKAADWIEKRSTPWFAWVHCYDPHTPYDPPAPFDKRHADPYDGEVAYVDAVLGRLIDSLGAEGEGRTVIVVTGDHGESLGEHGEDTHAYFAYNATLWIPLIISAPDLKPRQVGHYVSHIDIFPTVCDLLDIRPPQALQGVSLVRLLKGHTVSRPPIYIESLYPYYSHGWAPIRGFISGFSKFIDSPIPEIYDLTEDFHETTNLIDSKRMADDKKVLERLMDGLSHPGTAAARRPFDRQAMERLRSLGYLSGVNPALNKRFTQEDDVKRLLPQYRRVESAWALYKSGRREEAVRELEAILEKTKNLDMAYKRLAGIHSEGRRYDRSLAVLEEGLKQVPGSYEIFVDYIKDLNNAARPREVLSRLDEAPFKAVEFDPEMWYNRGLAHMRLSDPDGAIEAFEKGMTLDERYPELVDQLAEALLARAVATKRQELFENAEETFKKAIGLDPDYARPYNGLGKVYRIRGRLNDAIRLWETALAKEPTHPGSLFNLGAALLERGEPRRALPYLRKYKELYYNRLSPRLQKNLDSLILRCLQ